MDGVHELPGAPFGRPNVQTSWTIVRERFFPAQLRKLMAGELSGLAAQRKFRLIWSGWDRSLPRMYLPIAPLLRLLFEAADGIMKQSNAAANDDLAMNLRVQWQPLTNSTLVISLECDRWECDSRFRGALNARWFHQSSQAHLWQRLARQCDMVGGWLCVTGMLGGGTALSIHLPIDQPRALVHSWLSHQLARSSQERRAPEQDATAIDTPMILSLFAVGRSQRENIEQLRAANIRLQSLARPEDYVYRVAHGRWVWLTRHDALPAFMQTPLWQSQLLDRWPVNPNGPALLDLADKADRRFRQMLGTRVPPLDLRTYHVSRGPLTTNRPHTRVDSARSVTHSNHLPARAPAKSRQTAKWRYPI
jgi:hypothetical protein